MNEQLPSPEEKDPSHFRQEVKAKVKRKLKAHGRSSSGVWFGLGMMGLIGWSVVVPTLLGAAIGAWLDRHYQAKHSWTLSLLVAGLLLGCWIAWQWVAKEEQAMREEEEEGINE